MESRNAIKFLIEQVVEQAGLEEVPPTELEKQMIAFTESDPSVCADPVALNEVLKPPTIMLNLNPKLLRYFNMLTNG